MTAINKEKVYDQLRSYHVDAFPEVMSTDFMTTLRAEFATIEDAFVSMILGLVNGKTLFVDFTDKLTAFQKRIDDNASDRAETKDREQFTRKNKMLNEIMISARDYNFQLHRVRMAKAAKA